MSNESNASYKPEEQDALLVGFYNNILAGKDEPSTGYQKKFFLQLLNTKISRLDVKTRWMKRAHYFLGITVMLASGFTTVLLGLKLSVDPIKVSNTALITSAIITFLSGLAVFSDIENYWIRNKIMLNKLKEIRYEYVFLLTGNPESRSADLRPFLEKFLSCLGDEYWEKFLNNAGPVATVSSEQV